MKSINTDYIKGIDHLRCFAAILILLYHSFQLVSTFLISGKAFAFDDWLKLSNPLYALIVEGHIAVALFMVMSGFILTYGFLDKAFKYKDFITNRILRIYPLFIVLIFLGMAVYPQNFSFIALTQTIMFFSNMEGSLNLGPISGIFWTISVEFQFYLIFPFLITILNKENGYKKIMLMIVAMVVFRTIGCLLGGKPTNLSYWFIIGRIDQFLIGMLTAYLYKKNIIITPNYKKWFLLSLLMIILSLFIFNKAGGMPAEHSWKIYWVTFEGLLCAAFILSYINICDNMVNSIISRAFCYIGSISYSIYLLHFLVIDIFIKHNYLLRFNINTYKLIILNSLVLIVPAVILLSSLTYYAIEKPFLGLRRKY
jgi:peptidoglycan/LPS O-acetylase OafA/YrhL